MMKRKEKQKQKKEDSQVEGNVDTMLARIETVLNQHMRLNRMAERAVNDMDAGVKRAQKVDFGQFVDDRNTYKMNFVNMKQNCLAEIERIQDDTIKANKHAEMTKSRERYKELREEFKNIGVEDYVEHSERNQLFDGAKVSTTGKVLKTSNDGMLTDASNKSKQTTNLLKEGLNDINESQAIAEEVAVTLQGDREKIKRITHNLDEVESDLEIGQKLLTRFIKRLYTDKIVIGLTCLIACAVLAAICYSIFS